MSRSIFSGKNSGVSQSKVTKQQLMEEMRDLKNRMDRRVAKSDSESDTDTVRPDTTTKKRSTNKNNKEAEKPRRKSLSSDEERDSGAQSDDAADSLANHFDKGVSVKPTPTAQQKAAERRTALLKHVYEKPLSANSLSKIIAETREGGNYEPSSHKAWATSFKKNGGTKGFLPQTIEKYGRSNTFTNKFPEVKDTNEREYLALLKTVVEASRVRMIFDDQKKVIDQTMDLLGVEQTRK